ncbi:gp58-like family protein, partial [Leuconostoc mesenteroides]
TALGQIETKISKTDYDKKTGELSHNVNEAKDTADKALRTIGDYKTSNDKRVHEAESSIERTANAITEKVSKTDYDKKTGDLTEAVSKVKITAEDISNFVRDSNGNISSDFQTALSRTSIITGSTLAASIKTQTSSQISSALTDNNGKIISLINQDSSGVQIAGKNIVLDGDTTVTGDFYAKGGNFKNLNATNITFGTLNGNQVNITNITADNIVSGAISGANLNINLNTGSVVFQKGRINSSDYTTDINIDQGYISTANDNTRALIKQGMIQLVAPNRFDLDSSPYMEISNNRGQSTAGAAIVGRDSVSIANSKNAKNIFPTPLGEETFSGLYTGQAFDGGWLPTKVAGANRGVVVAGGTETTWQVVNNSPYIFVGTDAGGSYSYGNRVAIQAEYLHAETVYYHYASGGGNVYISSDGALLKSSSATKYKTNIEHETDSIQGDQLLTIDPATWNDKFEAEQLERYHETGVEPERQINMEGKRYYGIIAEDLVKAGLEELVTRNEETDEVEGVEYSKIGVALIPIVRDLRNRLNEQYVEIERLKDKIK